MHVVLMGYIVSLLMTGHGSLGIGFPSEDAWEDLLDAFARIEWSLIPSL